MVKKDNTRIQVTISNFHLNLLSCFAEYLNLSKSDLINLALREYILSHSFEFEQALKNSPPSTAG